MTLNDGLYASDKMDWETPHDLFAMLNSEFNFMLDPCCVAETAKCPIYYTPQHDGLIMPWFGHVFMNPPYGREIKHWVKKAFDERLRCGVIVCLVPCRTDTKWWHDYVMRSAEIRLLSRRLTFHGGTNKAPFPAAIVIFKPGEHSPVLRSMRI